MRTTKRFAGALDRAAALLDIAAAFALCVLLGGDSVPQIAASLALHEAAHLAVMYALGARRVRLSAAPFGFRLRYGAASLPRRARLAISLAGCAANAALAAVLLALGAFRFAAINVSLAAFNILPISGLDGAEALSTILDEHLEPRRAHAICSAVSLFFALTLWLFAVYVQLCVRPTPEILLASSFLLLRELT